jgi:hypothetical protein
MIFGLQLQIREVNKNMKKIFSFPFRNINIKIAGKQIILVIFLGSLIAGCSIINGKMEQTNTESNSNYIITPVSLEDTLTPTGIYPTATPSPTNNKADIFDMQITIDFKQDPVYVLTVNPFDKQYIYQDVQVVFDLGQFPNTRRYINLDGLNNNGFNNSDILIMTSTGRLTSYNLYTTNNAQYYFSGKKQMDYSSCLEHFPLSGFNALSYKEQSYEITSGESYCILTNEGHMAVVNLLQDSTKPNDEYNINLILVVSVYKQIVSKAYTPIPTETPGPTPTANRYSGLNLSDDQLRTLENSIQNFITNVTKKDKYAVSEMINYPLYLSRKDEETILLNNQNEFLQIYDGLFSDQVISELSQSTLDDNVKMSEDSVNISLSVKDCIFQFNFLGELFQIICN